MATSITAVDLLVATVEKPLDGLCLPTMVDTHQAFWTVPASGVALRNAVAVSTGSPASVPVALVGGAVVVYLATTSALVAVMTTLAGVLQRVPFDGPVLLSTSADPVTALSVEGDGTFEYLVAGT